MVFLGFWLLTLISGLLPNSCPVSMLLISVFTVYWLLLIFSLKPMGFGFMIPFKDVNIVSRVSEKRRNLCTF